MKVAIIGGGHIGGACARGFHSAGINVTVTARTEATLSKYAGINTSLDNKAAISAADIVILAVKTAQMQPLLDNIGDLLREKLTISLAAQVEPETISRFSNHLVYAMPNTAAEFRNSVTFLSNINGSNNDLQTARSLFENIGLAIEVPFQMFRAGTLVASCGIGYAMEYMAAAVEGACKLGFSRDEAAKIVCKTVMGACQVVEANSFHPEEEVKKVATPGGLTERGLNAMRKSGFTAAVISGLTTTEKKYTPDRITELKENEVFVFGSNLQGMHAGGAARVAVDRFGAIWGQGTGLQGQSYAIPTMQGGVETIKPYTDEFIEFAKSHPKLYFLVTRIGCGIAGFNDEDIAPLFSGAYDLPNVSLPLSFAKIISNK